MNNMATVGRANKNGLKSPRNSLERKPMPDREAAPAMDGNYMSRGLRGCSHD